MTYPFRFTRTAWAGTQRPLRHNIPHRDDWDETDRSVAFFTLPFAPFVDVVYLPFALFAEWRLRGDA